MKKILVMQSRRKSETIAGEQAEYLRCVEGLPVELVFKNTTDENLLWDAPAAILEDAQGVIFGGSGEFDFDGGREDDDPARLTAHAIRDRVRAFIDYLFAQNIPTLGICFGHQIIGELRGSKVVSDPLQKKVGTHDVDLTVAGESDVFTKALPKTFAAQYGHKDSLSSLPTGAQVLATGDSCTYSALRYSDKIYTMQFHPELTAADTMRKLKNSTGYLPDGIAVEDITRESNEASTLIPRFVQEIVG